MSERKKQSATVDYLAPGLPLDDFLPYLFNRITTRLNRDLLKDLRRLNITVSRWRVIAVLSARDGRPMSELAVYAITEQSTLSRVIDQMVRDGLVERRASDEDSRVINVWLTENGRMVFAELLPTALRQMDRIGKNLTTREIDTLSRLLHKVLDGIRVSPFE